MKKMDIGVLERLKEKKQISLIINVRKRGIHYFSKSGFYKGFCLKRVKTINTFYYLILKKYVNKIFLDYSINLMLKKL